MTPASARRRLPAVVGLLALAAAAWTVAGPDGGAGPSARGSDGDPAVVTAPVERRVLETLQVTRGTVVSPAQATVHAPPPGDGEHAVIVTAVPHAPGGQVHAGAVVLEVNGRPVLALPGAIPLYRDIRPGDTGPDVDAVQDALRLMGHEIPEYDEAVFGPRTRSALEEVYAAAGYTAAYTLGDEAAVDGARAAAATAVEAAASRVEEARAAGGAALEAAEGELAAAEAERDRLWEAEGLVLAAHEVVAVPSLPAALVELRVTEGQAVEAGAALASIGSPQFQVRIELTGAQVNELADDVAITVHANAGYEAACPAGRPQPTGAGSPAASGDPSAAPGNPSAGGDPTAPGGGNAAAGSGPMPAPSDGGAVPPSESDGTGTIAATDDYQMLVTCDPPPPAGSLGENLRVTMTVRRSDGPVLVVPATAITTPPSGEPFVEVVDGAGEPTRVTVTVGGEAEGFVAVAPTTAGALEEGMDVRVRRR